MPSWLTIWGLLQWAQQVLFTWIFNSFQKTRTRGAQLWIMASHMHSIFISDQSEILHAETSKLLRQNSLALRGHKIRVKDTSPSSSHMGSFFQKRSKDALFPIRVLWKKKKKTKEKGKCMLPRTTKRLKQNPLHSPSTFSKSKDGINCRANWKEGKVG